MLILSMIALYGISLLLYGTRLVQTKNDDLIYEEFLRINMYEHCFRVDMCFHLSNSCKTKQR